MEKDESKKKEKDKKKFSYYNEFFKVYLSELSSCEMMLPPAFTALLSINQEAISNNATLKDHNEKIWNVKLEMNEGGMIIKDGWKDFVLHHSLVDGDFLVFKYVGCSQFEVEIYGINGLKKGKAKKNGKVNGNIHVKEAPNVAVPSGCKAKNAETGKVINGRIHVKKESETEEGHIGSWLEVVAAGGCKGKDAETIKCGASCGESVSEPSETQVRKLPSEFQAVAKETSFAASKNPRFVWKKTKTKNSVYIPRVLVKEHVIKMQKEMKVLDENDKLWPVTALFWDNGQIILSAGWMRFCREKRLEVGDECFFEFILEKGNVCNVIKVEIVRQGSDARPQKHGKSKDVSLRACPALSFDLPRREAVLAIEHIMNPTSQHVSSGGKNTDQRRHEDEVKGDGVGALDRAMSFKSENAYFWITMQQSHVRPGAVLKLPQWFSQKYLQKSTSNIILSDPDGKIWLSEFLFVLSKGNSRVNLTDGWAAFAQANHLKTGDVCVFEMIKSDEITLQVHIFRDVGSGGHH